MSSFLKVCFFISFFILSNCGDHRPLKERDRSRARETSELVELSVPIKEAEVGKKTNEGGLYIIVKNYLSQRQDDLNIQLHQSKNSRSPLFVLSKNVKFGESKSFQLSKEQKEKLGNSLYPRVLSSAFTSYIYWDCSYEGQGDVRGENIDISNTSVLILEITQCNSLSYSCRVTRKNMDELEPKDEESMIHL